MNNLSAGAKKLFFIVVAAVIVAGVVIVIQSYTNTAKRTTTVSTPDSAFDSSTTQAQSGQYTAPPEMVIDPGKTYTATLETSSGTVVLELFASENPVTVNNFVFLAREGFYDGTKFHRIIRDFMIQGGDPVGNGTGGPGYTFPDEPITRDYTKGIIAMANRGPDTNGSQFFIMHGETPLPKSYVIFGTVTSGLDVVDAIANTPVSVGPTGEASVPAQDVLVTKVTITEK